MGDMLESIFEMQKALNQRVGVDTDTISLDDAQTQQWIRNYVLALSQESAELIDSTVWKWWSKYQTFDRQNAKVEVVDMLHFLVSLMQVLCMNAADVYDCYTQKWQVNQARQDSGYTEKDDEDCRHIG